MSDYTSHACQHCGKAIDQLQLCSCLKAITVYVRTRTSLDFVADALLQADKDIKSLRTQLADATRKLEVVEKALKHIKSLPAEYASFHDSTSRQGYGIRYLEVQEIIDQAIEQGKGGDDAND
jgi:hypothetical protein